MTVRDYLIKSGYKWSEGHMGYYIPSMDGSIVKIKPFWIALRELFEVGISVNDLVEKADFKAKQFLLTKT